MASKGDIEAGKAHVTLYVRNSALVKGLGVIKTELQGLGTSIMKLGGMVTAMGTAISAPIGAAVNQFISMGTELQGVASKTGLGVKALGEFKHAAEQTGATLGDVEGASKSVTKSIHEAAMGGSAAVVAFSRLGLSAAGLKQMKPEDQLQTIAERLATIKDPAQQAALATQLLGGTNLLAMIGQLGALRQEARDLGLAPSEKAVADAANLGRSIKRGLSVVTAAIFEIGAAVAPTLFPVAEAIIRIGSSVTKWVRENGELIRTIAKIGAIVVAVGAAITGIGATVFGLGAAFGTVATVATTVGSAIGGIVTILSTMAALAAPVLIPLGLVLLAVGGITVALGGTQKAWAAVSSAGKSALDTILAMLMPFVDTLRDAFGGIADALMAGDLSLAAQVAITGLQLIFAQGVQAISNMLGKTFGDTFGAIGNKVIKGDFLGAWETALKQLSAWHSTIVEGITAMWTLGARAAVDAWRDSVNQISDSLLEASSKGGILGKVASMILGVDLQEEIARGKNLDNRLGITSPDALEEAKRYARSQTSEIADGMLRELDRVDRDAQAKTDAANAALNAETVGAMDGMTDEVKALKEQLAKLTAAAAQARANARAGGAGDVVAGARPTGGDMAMGAALRQSTGSFSASALQLSGHEPAWIAIQREQLRIAREQLAFDQRRAEEERRHDAAVMADFDRIFRAGA